MLVSIFAPIPFAGFPTQQEAMNFLATVSGTTVDLRAVPDGTVLVHDDLPGGAVRISCFTEIFVTGVYSGAIMPHRTGTGFIAIIFAGANVTLTLLNDEDEIAEALETLGGLEDDKWVQTISRITAKLTDHGKDIIRKIAAADDDRRSGIARLIVEKLDADR